MNNWKFEITPEAKEDFRKIDTEIQRRIKDKLLWLVINFDIITPIPLNDPWKGFFKLRIGDWRLLYEIEHVNHKIIVHRVGKRSDIYKKLD